MKTLNRTFNLARRTLALSAMLGAGLVAAHAQQMAAPATTTEPKLNLKLPAVAQTTFSSSSDENSSQDNAVAVADNHFDFLAVDNAQPPSRGYGRPRYRGSNTNADGSNKWGFLGGVGYVQPIGNTYHYLNPSWGFQVGGGRNFSKKFGVMLQFDYDNFGFNKTTLDNQLNLYNTAFNIFNSTLPGGSEDPNAIPPLTSLDGSTHVWSFTLNPTYTFYSSDSWGAYVVAGVGFYHKVADFTTPETQTEEDEFGDIFQFEANGTVDHYSSNAPGFNGGFGLTYKFSRFSNERFYAEARYVFVDNSQRAGVTVNTISLSNLFVANDFPANSNRTTYIPVKFGIRF
jgi:hypothetical protein